MKKNKFLKLAFLIPTMFALSGCIFADIIREQEKEIVVDLPKIETVTSMKINLQGRTTKNLYPTLSNNSVKNPEYIYSSSDDSVATVSSDGLVKGLKVGTTNVTITLKANTKVKTTVKVVVVDEVITTYDYTIMFYMCASDLEYNANLEDAERFPFFTEDIKEILSVHDMPDEVKIIIETGGTVRWSMQSTYLEGATKISSTNLQRWEVDNETYKLKIIETLPTNYMACESSFSEFLSWGLDDYPAEQMGVVLSGHGGGIAGCAYDDNYTTKVGNQYWQKTLRTFEVANAAKKALKNSNREKFTWIGYDCCVMQCADIATINSDYFEYMVASQENENATGWNHDIYLPHLYEDTKIEPTAFLPKICDAFYVDNHHDGETGKEICYQTLSVLDLSKVETLVTTFNNFCRTLGSNGASFNIAEMAFKSSLNSFGGKIFGLCDFDSLMKNFKTINTTEVQEAIHDLVIYKKNCSKYITEPSGVNAFFPLTLDSDYILQVGKEDYSNSLSTKFTYWQNMCVTYGRFGWESI